VAEVDVKEATLLVHHDVVRVTVADAEYERGHAVAGTGARENVYGCLESVRARVVCRDPAVELHCVELVASFYAALHLDLE